jgi:hypothetical protein
MSTTAGADLYGALEDAGINRFIGHIVEQRPSLFNYATPGIAAHRDLLCRDVAAAESVRNRNNPTVTTVGRLPVLGSDGPIELEYCLQLTAFEFDFHPGGAFVLPDGESLAEGEFAVHVQACAGLGCPSDAAGDFRPPFTVPDPVLPPTFPDFPVATGRGRFFPDGGTEPVTDGGRDVATFDARTRGGFVAAPRLAGSRTVSRSVPRTGGTIGGAGSGGIRIPGQFDFEFPGFDVLAPIPLVPRPDVTMQCFCLDVFLVGSVDMVTRDGQRAPEFDIAHLELATEEGESLDFPLGMKNAIECYLDQLIRHVLLPAAETAVRESVGELLDLPLVQVELTADDPQVSFPETSAIPNNPAVEDDQLKIWIDLDLVGGSS